MIFDQESEINISEVFSRYKIDKAALKKDFRAAKSDTQRDRIRKVGSAVQSLFKKGCPAIVKRGRKGNCKIRIAFLF